MQLQYFLRKRIFFFLLPRFFLILFVFIASLIILPYFVGGDQVHYIRVYYELSNLGLIEGYIFYNLSLSSYEFVHFFLSWFFSRVMDKNLFIALFNAILALSVILIFDKRRVYFFVTVLFMVSNFYLLVLFFSAERLKFGTIFFLLSVYYFDRIKIFSFFVLISVSAHAQFIIIYGGILFNWLIKKCVRLYRTGLISLTALYILVFSLLLVFLMSSQLQVKFIAYFRFSEAYDFLRLGVFFLMAIWYSSKKQQTVFVFLPLFIAVMLFGGDRVNMFGYFVFLFYALQVNRGLNLGVAITSAYFAYASYNHLLNIIIHGDGFYTA